MKIDLGCGSHPRGDLGITLKDHSSPTDATTGIDRDLEKYGFIYNPNSTIIYGDLNNLEIIKKYVKPNDEILMSHILEHLQAPYYVLKTLSEIGISRIIIVIPNPKRNDADWKDKEHIYSWTSASLSNLVSLFFKMNKIELINHKIDILLEAFGVDEYLEKFAEENNITDEYLIRTALKIRYGDDVK